MLSVSFISMLKLELVTNTSIIYSVRGSCDFDAPSLCDWASDATSDFECRLSTGQSTDFPASGPPSDHTLKSKGKEYTF